MPRAAGRMLSNYDTLYSMSEKLRNKNYININKDYGKRDYKNTK